MFARMTDGAGVAKGATGTMSLPGWCPCPPALPLFYFPVVIPSSRYLQNGRCVAVCKCLHIHVNISLNVHVTQHRRVSCSRLYEVSTVYSSLILDWQNNDGFWFLPAEMATTISTSYQPSLAIVQTQQVWSLLDIYTCQASHNHIYCSAKIYVRKLKYIKSFHLGAFSKPLEYNTFLFLWGFLNIQMLCEKIHYTVDMLLNKPSKGQSCWHNFEMCCYYYLIRIGDILIITSY